ncbi:ROK family protein [Aquibacillus kalidii]|uniref:ROK family protein n=1 Tax=Aquibacillus kalidii TaxID=2762597 RepID=UPI001C98E5F0|nr:ROK family protein [Aquibacillus kalidii]
MYYGGIEAGGTKFVCAISNDKFEIIERVSIPTTTPNETISQVFNFFDQYQLKSIGIGSFGPIDVNKDSKTYGFITSTPKQGWQNYNFVGDIKKRYNVPVAWTTDVNAAAYGESKKGNAKSQKSCIYLTVGTGVGGGFVTNGDIIDGYGHPEMGHIILKIHDQDDFKGNCPYHSNCLEGLAAGPAIEKRNNKKGQDLGKDDKTWEFVSYYIAQALVNYTLTVRPEIIILGGGVMKQEHLLPLIREQFKALMNDYVETPDLESYIVSPGLGDNAGITGSLILAADKAE